MSANITSYELRRLAEHFDSLADQDGVYPFVRGEAPEVCEVHMATNGSTGKVDVTYFIDTWDEESEGYEIQERKVEV